MNYYCHSYNLGNDLCNKVVGRTLDKIIFEVSPQIFGEKRDF